MPREDPLWSPFVAEQFLRAAEALVEVVLRECLLFTVEEVTGKEAEEEETEGEGRKKDPPVGKGSSTKEAVKRKEAANQLMAAIVKVQRGKEREGEGAREISRAATVMEEEEKEGNMAPDNKEKESSTEEDLESVAVLEEDEVQVAVIDEAKVVENSDAEAVVEDNNEVVVLEDKGKVQLEGSDGMKVFGDKREVLAQVVDDDDIVVVEEDKEEEEGDKVEEESKDKEDAEEKTEGEKSPSEDLPLPSVPKRKNLSTTSSDSSLGGGAEAKKMRPNEAGKTGKKPHRKRLRCQAFIATWDCRNK